MVIFLSILAAVVALNVLLLVFSTSLRFEFKNEKRSSVPPALNLKDFRLDSMESEYRKAV